jgi:O-antigen ligase
MLISSPRIDSWDLSLLYRLGLYGLLIGSPLLLGSNRPLFWGMNGVVAPLTVAVFAWSELTSARPSPANWHLPQVSLLGMLAVAVWIAIQASPWTPTTWHHPIWFSSPILADAKSAISADPTLTWEALGWWSTLCVFIVAVRFGVKPRVSIFLLRLMLGVCVGVASFGLMVEYFGLNTLGITSKNYYRGWLTGTFVNRNSAASFLGIGLIIAVGLASRAHFYRVKSSRSNTLTQAVPICAAIFLFVALLETGSRAGIATTIVGAACALLFEVIKQRRLNLRAIVVLLSGLAVSVSLMFGVVQFRIATAESTEIRLSLYAESLKAIADRPILGHGAGAFSSIQPLYHSATTPSNTVWDNAHSTVLEILVTLGIPAVLFAVTILGYILSRLAVGWRSSAEETTCLNVLFAVTVAVSLHAFVDFSLEMQAIALYVACLLGLAIGEAMSLEVARMGTVKTQSTETSQDACLSK